MRNKFLGKKKKTHRKKPSPSSSSKIDEASSTLAKDPYVITKKCWDHFTSSRALLVDGPSLRDELFLDDHQQSLLQTKVWNGFDTTLPIPMLEGSFLLEKPVEENNRITFDPPILQQHPTHPLSINIHSPFQTRNGIPAVKPIAFVNKRTTTSLNDKVLMVTIKAPDSYDDDLPREAFSLKVVVPADKFGNDGGQQELSVVIKGQEEKLVELNLDPEGNELLVIEKEEKMDEKTWKFACKFTTSNNFGWKTKYQFYQILCHSKDEKLQSALSNPFKVTQNVSYSHPLNSLNTRNHYLVL